MSEYKYLAFISYKREDERWAKWLQHKLEHYRLPSIARKEKPNLPIYARPVCKDTTDLEPGRLAEKIGEKLAESRFLIVICSKRAALSEWVDKEIREFVTLGRADRIIPFIIDGEPNSKQEVNECFPPALRTMSGEQELLGVNIHEMGKDAAAVKCVARMFDLGFDTLWQRHERERRRRYWWGFAMVVTVAVVATIVALILQLQKNQLLVNQSRAVAQAAMQLIDEGDIYTAQSLAMEVLPRDVEHPSRPIVPEAEAALRKAYSANSGEGFKSVARLLSKEWRIVDIAYSDYDNRVAVVTDYPDNYLYIFDSTNGEICAKHDMSLVEPMAVVYSGEYLYIGGCNETLYWADDVGSLAGGSVGDVGYSHDIVDIATSMGTIVYATEDGKISILRASDMWDVGYEEIASFETDYSIHDIEISPSANRLVIIEGDRYRPSSQDLRVIDIYSESEHFGECIKSWRPHEETISDVDFFDDDWVVTSSENGDVTVWNIATGDIHDKQNYDESVTSLDFYSDGISKRGILIGFRSGEVSLLITDIESDTSYSQVVKVGDNPVAKLLFDESLAQFCAVTSSPYSTTMEDEVRLFARGSGTAYKIDADMSLGGAACQFSHDNQYLYISSTEDGSLHRAILEQYGSYWSGDVAHIERLDWFDDVVGSEYYNQRLTIRTNPANEILAARIGFYGPLYLYNPDIGDRICVSNEVFGGECFAFSDDGRLLAYISYEEVPEDDSTQYYVAIVDTSTGEQIGERINLDVAADHVRFMPDNSHVAVICDRRENLNFAMFMTYDIASGEQLDCIEYASGIDAFDISPDGRVVALAFGAKVQIIDIESREILCEMKGHTGTIQWVEFSPDGGCIASAGLDSTLRVWNIERGCEMLREPISYYEMGVGSFCHDGLRLAFPGRDDCFHLVNYPPLQDLIQTGEYFYKRDLTAEERRTYYLEEGSDLSPKLSNLMRKIADINYGRLFTMLLMFLSAVAPVVMLIYYIRRRDAERPEPVGQLVKAFVFGVLTVGVSMTMSLPFESLGLYTSNFLEGSVGDAILTAFFGAAIPEEVAKFLLLWLLLRKNRHFDENMDGIVYAVCVSMGFACVENLMYIFSSEDMWFHTSLSRALFAVPGHFAFAVLMGYYYSLSRFSTTRRKFNRAMILVAPILAHGIYDALLMASDVAPEWSFLLLFGFFAFCRNTAQLCKDSIQAHANRDKGVM